MAFEGSKWTLKVTLSHSVLEGTGFPRGPECALRPRSKVVACASATGAEEPLVATGGDQVAAGLGVRPHTPPSLELREGAEGGAGDKPAGQLQQASSRQLPVVACCECA